MSDGYTALRDEIQMVFGQCEMPETLFDASEYFRAQNLREIDVFERLNWDSASIDDLKIFHECNTFLSRKAYFYLLPKVFEFCQRWTSALQRVDFIDVFFRLPIIRQDDGFLENLSLIQRSLLWRFLTCGSDLVG